MMFPLSGQNSAYRSAPPTPNDLGTFISAIQGELQYVKGDPILWSAVTRGVVKAVQLFTTKVCFRVTLECFKERAIKRSGRREIEIERQRERETERDSR